MKQNYNDPLFEFEVTFNESGGTVVNKEAFSAAFKSEYPTAKEAINFIKSGGSVVCVAHEDESESGPATDTIMLNLITMQSVAVMGNGSVRIIYSVLGGGTGNITYGASGGGGGQQ